MERYGGAAENQGEIEEKLARMREELRELQDFCEMADRDQQVLLQLTDEIDEENKMLRISMELRKNGDNTKILR